MAELTTIDAATKRFIRETPKLVDLIFQQGPMIAYARLNAREEFTGGRLIAENFQYDGLIGGPYLKGKEFNITQPQIEQQLGFFPKFSEVNITLFKEDIQVINKGPNQAFPILRSRVEAAYRTMGAHQELGFYLNGSRAGFEPNIVGAAEAINDNVTVSWDNNTYANYGTIPRSATKYPGLNSAPIDVNGTIEYTTLNREYGNVTYGPGEYEPNLVSTTILGYSLVKEKFQAQQRFNDTQDPNIGFNGMKFNNATFIQSRYCPGSYLFGSSGTADSVAVTFMKEMSLGALTAYPTPVGGYPAAGTLWETIWMFNARRPFFNFYLSDDPEFGYGTTGFKPGQGNTTIVCQLLWAGACSFAPRYHKQLYRITG